LRPFARSAHTTANGVEVEFVDGTVRRYAAREHLFNNLFDVLGGQIIPAAPNSRVAVCDPSTGKVEYQSVIAFAIKSHERVTPITIGEWLRNYAALIDPQGCFTALAFDDENRRNYKDEAAFVPAVKEHAQRDKALADRYGD
jgi:hypothetical protein